jgi:hypothetical protein
MNVCGTRSVSGKSGALGMPFWARSAHVVKFRPVRIECARKGVRQFANTPDNTAAHATSPKRFIELASFPLGSGRKARLLPQTFGEKSLKIGTKPL